MPTNRSLNFEFDPRPPPPKDEGPRTLTVAELDRSIKRTLEGSFADPVWVCGEVTGARPAPSGHLYFCLRDEKEEAAVDVAMYKSSITPRARALLVDGTRVRLRGVPTFWAPRGRLQFIVDRAEAAGRGAILEALERLKAKLLAEGLFAPERKRKLPSEPRIIGVVTSGRGAAIHDICKVAFQRGGVHILLAPAIVQGAEAVESIRRALYFLQRVEGVEVIILGRGGGGADDLSAFNEELVVRAVASSRVPIVSAVGHEVDVSLTDLAADVRAATPSHAAELLVPDVRARKDRLEQTHRRLLRAMKSHLSEGARVLAAFDRRLGDPRLAIASSQQLLDDRLSRMTHAVTFALRSRHERAARLEHRLALCHPKVVLDRERALLQRARERIEVAGRRMVERRAFELSSASARLDALSPLKVLARGYAIAETEDGRAVREADDVREGDLLEVRVRAARVHARVLGVEKLR